MTYHEFVKKFNDFLLDQCGITNTLFDHVRLDKKEPIKSLFFNPYQSKKEFFYKTASVVTAPICLSVIALELAATSLYLGLKSAVKLAQLDTRLAKLHLMDGVFHMVFALVAAIAAVASPIINLVDLVGSGVSTLRQKNESHEEMPQEEMQPSFN